MPLKISIRYTRKINQLCYLSQVKHNNHHRHIRVVVSIVSWLFVRQVVQANKKKRQRSAITGSLWRESPYRSPMRSPVCLLQYESCIPVAVTNGNHSTKERMSVPRGCQWMHRAVLWWRAVYECKDISKRNNTKCLRSEQTFLVIITWTVLLFRRYNASVEAFYNAIRLIRHNRGIWCNSFGVEQVLNLSWNQCTSPSKSRYLRTDIIHAWKGVSKCV